MGYLAVFLCSVALTLVLIPFCIKLAQKSDFLDYPSTLKIHGRPTPLLGGLAVFIGFWVAVLLGLAFFKLTFSRELIGILTGATAVAVLGQLAELFGEIGVRVVGD